MEKIYNFEMRLVRFAVEVIRYVQTIGPGYAQNYYSNQVIRSSGSSALHYGEAQGTTTHKDFRHKMTGVVKELK